MPSEKLIAYLNLVNAAERQPFGKLVDGLVIRGLVARLVWAKMQAQEAGLTPAEIQAAVQIGESRNPLRANPPLDTTDYAPGNTEAYWEAVYREAIAFWASRSGGEEEE